MAKVDPLLSDFRKKRGLFKGNVKKLQTRLKNRPSKDFSQKLKTTPFLGNFQIVRNK